MSKPLRQEDLSIRPIFRIAGAMLMAFGACVLLWRGWPLFEAPSLPAEQCLANKRRLLCELGNRLLGIIPTNLQGPMAAAAHLLMAALLAAAIVLLVGPVFRKR